MNAPAKPVADVIALDEPTAAAMLGLDEHVLRSERLKGRISASRIAGGRIRYSQSDLDDYLVNHRFMAAGDVSRKSDMSQFSSNKEPVPMIQAQTLPPAGVLNVPTEPTWLLRSPRAAPAPTFYCDRSLAVALCIQFNSSDYARRRHRWGCVYHTKQSAYAMLSVRVNPDERPTDPAAFPPGVEPVGTLGDAELLAAVRNEQILKVAAVARCWWLAVTPLVEVLPDDEQHAEGDAYHVGVSVGGVIVAKSAPFTDQHEAQRAFENSNTVLLSPTRQ